MLAIVRTMNVFASVLAFLLGIVVAFVFVLAVDADLGS